MAHVSRIAALVLGTLVLGAACLDAHAFWITAAGLRLSPAQTTAFTVGFGERFPLPHPLPEAREVPIRVFSPSGAAIPLRERSEITPEGLLKGRFPTGTEPGVYVVDAALYAKAIDYTAAEFQSYLTREQFTNALSFRKALREENREARELLTMFAKTFVRVGGGTAVPPRIGTRLEIAPLTDPTTLRVGVTGRFRVLSNNGGLANAPITAMNAASKTEPRTGRTNATGEIEFVFSEPGLWLLRTVQMIPRPALAEGRTDWASYWASVTVNVAPK